MAIARTTTIQRCVEQLNAGQPESREALLRVTRDRLLAMIRNLLASYPSLRRWEQSDDVLQNVHVRLLRCLDQVPLGTARDFLSLAATSMRRELIDLTRHYYGLLGGGRHQVTPGAEAPLAEPAAAGADPAVLAEWAELHEHVSALPAEEREVVDLHWYHDLTQEEVAGLLGVSTRTVKRRWTAAKARLAARLGRPSSDEPDAPPPGPS